MAWVTQSNVSTGDLVDAAAWNQAVIANDNALRGGGVAITSQSANDVIFASSATQLARSNGIQFDDSTDTLTLAGNLTLSGADVDIDATGGNLEIKAEDSVSIVLDSNADNAGGEWFKVFTDPSTLAFAVKENGQTIIGHSDVTTGVALDVNGVIRADNGSAAAPGIVLHEGSTSVDSGLFSPGADEISIATDGSERVRVTRLGKLAIGTTSLSGFVHAKNVLGCTAFYVEQTVSGEYAMVIRGGNTGATKALSIQNSSGTETCTVTNAGALSKASGSFRIPHPHPAKAATHDLVHSFVESNRAGLVYDGEVDLVAGSAAIDMDDLVGMQSGTWVLLTRDPHVFTSNETGWDAVRGAVSGATLTIESEDSSSTARVSFLVVAERQDPHMTDEGTDWTDDDGRPIIEPLREPTP